MPPFLLKTLCMQRTCMRYNRETTIRNSKFVVKDDKTFIHRLALGKIRYLVKFQDVLNSMFKYFANSPKNMSKLQAIQAVLQSSQTRLQQVFHTRWLSFEGSVQAVVDNYPSLVSVFIEDNSAKARHAQAYHHVQVFVHCTLPI